MSDELRSALEAYEAMHRRCTNITDWFAYAKHM